MDLDMTDKMKCNICDWVGFRCECVELDQENHESFDPVCPKCHPKNDNVCTEVLEEMEG